MTAAAIPAPTPGIPNIARWRFFMAEAAVSLGMAEISQTRDQRRMWTDLAASELEEARRSRYPAA